MIESVFTTIRKEGIAEGKIEGTEENKIATAEKMIIRDKPLWEIVEFSGLTERKIRQLAKKLSKDIVLQ